MSLEEFREKVRAMLIELQEESDRHDEIIDRLCSDWLDIEDRVVSLEARLAAIESAIG